MNILLLGAAGFIGTNLAIKLAENKQDEITLVDKKEVFFKPVKEIGLRVKIKEAEFSENTDFDALFAGQEIVYHLVSTTVPSTSNQHIADELAANVVVTASMLDSCVRMGIKKLVFISSGGTVYGNADVCPIKENTVTNPICSYGIQKVAIEKLLYLYQYMYGLDYRVIRLANPYGPYQRPNGVIGAVTTFTYKALKEEKISVYGDGSVIRDFIYIKDAVRGILNIVNGENHHHTFNLGCGYGTSIKQVLETIEVALGIEMNIVFEERREVDVPLNYLDISRYEKIYGKLDPISLHDGVLETADFIKNYYCP